MAPKVGQKVDLNRLMDVLKQNGLKLIDKTIWN